jgi:hypothetical protein
MVDADAEAAAETGRELPGAALQGGGESPGPAVPGPHEQVTRHDDRGGRHTAPRPHHDDRVGPLALALLGVGVAAPLLGCLEALAGVRADEEEGGRASGA